MSRNRYQEGAARHHIESLTVLNSCYNTQHILGHVVRTSLEGGFVFDLDTLVAESLQTARHYVRNITQQT